MGRPAGKTQTLCLRPKEPLERPEFDLGCLEVAEVEKCGENADLAPGLWRKVADFYVFLFRMK